MAEDTFPEPDRLDGVPHPRQTARLVGQEAAEREFLAAFATDRLHHGWLLTGPPGIGKATLAWRIARFLVATPQDAGLFGLPDSLDTDPGGRDNTLISAGAHPRLFVLRRSRDERSGKLRQIITVEDTRKLGGFFGLSAADGGRRVVIVDAADELNPQAANALLKLLEEPPARAILLLVCHQPARLLPTIRSRCRALRLTPLSADNLATALTQAGLAPDNAPALSALAGGSVGAAVRLLSHGGLETYATLVKLLQGLPRYDRPLALKLAESCAGPANTERYAQVLDLLDTAQARLARAGLLGPPEPQAAPGEARLLSKLSPDAAAARAWAQVQAATSARTRRGRAVNLDPATLILDTLRLVEDTAQKIT